MEIIKELAEHINEEIGDMKCYAMMACEYKDRYPELAETLYQLSTQEENHAKILHERAESIISEYRKSNSSVPADMLAVYEYLHKCQLEKKESAIRFQQMYKG